MNFSLSKQWGNIDFRVWITFLWLSVLSLGLLGYKVATYINCMPIQISAKGKLSHTNTTQNIFYVNEQIDFRAHTQLNAKEISWNFGDSSTLLEGIVMSHTYTKEGNYLVTVMINKKCTESINVRIIQTTTNLTDANAPVINPIVSGDVFSVGDECSFNTTITAENYVWSIDELPELGKRSTSNANYIFNKPGNYTVTLTLSDGRNFKKLIQVNDPLSKTALPAALPPVTPSDLPPAPIVSNAPPLPEKKEDIQIATEPKPATPEKTYDQLPTPAIQAMLEDVTTGRKNIEDFNNLLCNGAGTKVMANNEPTTFASLINELKEKKGLPLLKRKRKIKSVKVVRDEQNGNCVKILYVDFK